MNPIRALRHKFGLTQAQLAQEAGISTLAVLRYEQGIYETPSENIVNVFHSHNTNDDDEIFHLTQEYHDWRMEHQHKASRYINPTPPVLIVEGEHPFATWRKMVTSRAVGKDSRMSFCILLAIHPAVVLDYEKAKQRDMPALIQNALNNAGVDTHAIQGLRDMGEIYYERINSPR